MVLFLPPFGTEGGGGVVKNTISPILKQIDWTAQTLPLGLTGWLVTRIVQNIRLFSVYCAAGLPVIHKWDTTKWGGKTPKCWNVENVTNKVYDVNQWTTNYFF